MIETGGLRFRWPGEEPAIETVPWLVEGLIPAHGAGLMLGRSGAGKSFLAMRLACCIASGVPFLGREVQLTGGTAMLLGEAADTFSERLRWALEGLRLSDGDNMRPEQSPLLWASCGLPKAAADLADLGADIRQEMKTRNVAPRLAVVDTLTSAFSFANENDASEAGRVMKGLAALGEAMGCFVLALAHPGKVGGREIRGSNAFTGQADIVLSVERARAKGYGAAPRQGKVILVKSRRAPEGSVLPFALRATADGGMFAASPNDVVSPPGPPAEPETTKGGNAARFQVEKPAEAVVRIVRELEESGLRTMPGIVPPPPGVIAAPSRYVRDAFEGERPPRSPDAGRKAFQRAVESAVSAGRLERWGGAGGGEYLRLTEASAT
ncbi:AAA family ATPase [Acetobacter musti]|uniref:AAA family ATPase n=1 Tax=Acetobacter musti TaxID=864732 RepID=UPI00156B41D7